MPIDEALPPIMTLLADTVRGTRIRFAWSQRELSRRSGVPQSQISKLERHQITDIRMTDIDRILGALGVRYRLILEPPMVQTRLQGDLVHACCGAYVERRLVAAGWRVAREVEIGGDRSRGWIDLLAWHPGSRILLVIEIKSEIHDIGAIERTLNWYQREAWAAARRLGWWPRRVASALLLLQSEANDRAVAINRDVMAIAFPGRADALARLVAGDAVVSKDRMLAMVDPRSRRVKWLRGTRSEGRRSAAPYVDYIDAARSIELGTRRRPRPRSASARSASSVPQ